MPLPFIFIIMEDFSYEELEPDEPLMVDEDGLYITVSQMRFWLNSKRGRRLFRSGSSQFLKYYHSCRTYNLISDMLEEDPKCAKLFWDTRKGAPGFTFPIKGKVADRFYELGLVEEIEGDE